MVYGRQSTADWWDVYGSLPGFLSEGLHGMLWTVDCRPWTIFSECRSSGMSQDFLWR
jgi:hypothetical protein